MNTVEIEYIGELRTKNKHIKSGSVILTDAPTDNQGKGEGFSPTDLVATALADCAITIMAIKARTMDIELKGTKIDVKKIMSPFPRKIAKIIIDIYLPKLDISYEDKKILEETAFTCPVAKSLHPDIRDNINFIWE